MERDTLGAREPEDVLLARRRGFDEGALAPVHPFLGYGVEGAEVHGGDGLAVDREGVNGVPGAAESDPGCRLSGVEGADVQEVVGLYGLDVVQVGLGHEGSTLLEAVEGYVLPSALALEVLTPGEHQVWILLVGPEEAAPGFLHLELGDRVAVLREGEDAPYGRLVGRLPHGDLRLERHDLLVEVVAGPLPAPAPREEDRGRSQEQAGRPRGRPAPCIRSSAYPADSARCHAIFSVLDLGPRRSARVVVGDERSSKPLS